MEKEILDEDTTLDFMAGSAMIFSGFALLANELKNKVSVLEEKLQNKQIRSHSSKTCYLK